MSSVTDPASHIWLDEGEVNPAWSPPGGPPHRIVPPAAIYFGILVALALVLGLVWGFGGFERRTDVLRPTALGTLVNTGPYEFRFTSATAQQRTQFNDEVVWRVTMTGEGRTTENESSAPNYQGDYGMFAAKDEASDEVQIPTGQTFGPNARIGGAFTPGLPLQPYAVSFEFSEGYQPQESVSFVVYQLELRDASLLGNQDEEWRNADAAYRFELPLRVLPPAIS